MIKRSSTGQWLSILQAALAGVAVGGCTQEIGESEVVGSSENPIYVTGHYWPNSVVNVCIDPGDPGTPAQIADVQRLLAATWGKYSGVQFKGSSASGGGQPTWGSCSYAASEQGDYSSVALHFCTASSTSAWCLRKKNNRLVDYIGGSQSPGYYTGRTDNFVNVSHPFGY